MEEEKLQNEETDELDDLTKEASNVLSDENNEGVTSDSVQRDLKTTTNTDDNVNSSQAQNQYNNNRKSDKKNNGKENVDLKTLSVTTSEICYAYSLSLADKGHRLLATEITRLSLDNNYAASFVPGALSREDFGKHLAEGYYTTGKLYEVLSMVASLGLKQDKHDFIVDLVDRMHRMYAASIRTMQKKNIVPQTVNGF